MGAWVIRFLVLGFIAWAAWSLLQARYLFEIRVAGGQPYIRRGKVTKAFLGRVAVICQEYGVVRGWIRGELRGHRVALRFSRHFPPGSQQRLRNEWQTTG